MTSAAPSAYQSGTVGYYLLPQRIPETVWRHRQLIWQLIGRNVASRYRGSVLGIFWSFIFPLLMLAVYTFVFSVVFEARWEPPPDLQPAASAAVTQPAVIQPGATTGRATVAASAPAAAGGSKTQFALTLFCGLLMFALFAETVQGCAGVVTSNVSYVKKVVFPLEVLPVVTLGTALVNAGISLLILLVGIVLFTQRVPVTVPYFLLVAIPLVALSLGVGWFLASVGVFIRDTGHLVTVVVQMLFFLTPLFYPVSRVPESLQVFIWMNPLAVIVENGRRTLMHAAPPQWLWLVCVTVLSLAVMQLGYVWFMKTKRGFADVL